MDNNSHIPHVPYPNMGITKKQLLKLVRSFKAGREAFPVHDDTAVQFSKDQIMTFLRNKLSEYYTPKAAAQIELVVRHPTFTDTQLSSIQNQLTADLDGDYAATAEIANKIAFENLSDAIQNPAEYDATFNALATGTVEDSLATAAATAEGEAVAAETMLSELRLLFSSGAAGAALATGAALGALLYVILSAFGVNTKPRYNAKEFGATAAAQYLAYFKSVEEYGRGGGKEANWESGGGDGWHYKAKKITTDTWTDAWGTLRTEKRVHYKAIDLKDDDKYWKGAEVYAMQHVHKIEQFYAAYKKFVLGDNTPYKYMSDYRNFNHNSEDPTIKAWMKTNSFTGLEAQYAAMQRNMRVKMSNMTAALDTAKQKAAAAKQALKAAQDKAEKAAAEAAKKAKDAIDAETGDSSITAGPEVKDKPKPSAASGTGMDWSGTGMDWFDGMGGASSGPSSGSSSAPASTPANTPASVPGTTATTQPSAAPGGRRPIPTTGKGDSASISGNKRKRVDTEHTGYANLALVNRVYSRPHAAYTKFVLSDISTALGWASYAYVTDPNSEETNITLRRLNRLKTFKLKWFKHSGLDLAIVIGYSQHYEVGRQQIFISCRGTRPTAWQNVALDLDFEFVEPRELRMKNPNSRVHRGFYTATLSLATQIVKYLNSLNHMIQRRASVTVTGHSLGGAMATLLCAHTQFSKWADAHTAYGRNSHTRLITFGSPRVGNKTFVDEYETLPNLTPVRITDIDDPVTAVPLMMQGYRHVGLEYRIGRDGSLTQFYRDEGHSVADDLTTLGGTVSNTSLRFGHALYNLHKRGFTHSLTHYDKSILGVERAHGKYFIVNTHIDDE